MLSPDQVLKAAIDAKPRSALAAQLGGSRSWAAPTAKKEQPRKLSTRYSDRSPVDQGSTAVGAAVQPGRGLPTGSAVNEDSDTAADGQNISAQLTPEDLKANAGLSGMSTLDVEPPSAGGLKDASAASTTPADTSIASGVEGGFSKGHPADSIAKDPPSVKRTSSKKLAPSLQDTAERPGKFEGKKARHYTLTCPAFISQSSSVSHWVQLCESSCGEKAAGISYPRLIVSSKMAV